MTLNSDLIRVLDGLASDDARKAKVEQYCSLLGGDPSSLLRAYSAHKAAAALPDATKAAERWLGDAPKALMGHLERLALAGAPFALFFTQADPETGEVNSRLFALNSLECFGKGSKGTRYNYYFDGEKVEGGKAVSDICKRLANPSDDASKAAQSEVEAAEKALKAAKRSRAKTKAEKVQKAEKALKAAREALSNLPGPDKHAAAAKAALATDKAEREAAKNAKGSGEKVWARGLWKVVQEDHPALGARFFRMKREA